MNRIPGRFSFAYSRPSLRQSYQPVSPRTRRTYTCTRGVGNNTTIHPKTYPHVHPKEAKARPYYTSLPAPPTFRRPYYFPDEITYISAKPSQDAYVAKHLERPSLDPKLTLVDDLPYDTGRCTSPRQINTQGIYESDAHKASQSHSIFTDSSEGSSTQTHVSPPITLHSFIPIIPHQTRLPVKPGPYLYERHVVSTLVVLSLTLAPFNIYPTYSPSIPGARNSPPSFEMIACDGPDSAQSPGSAIHSEARISTYSDFIAKLIRRCHPFPQVPTLVSIGIRGRLARGSFLIGARKRRIRYSIAIFISASIPPPDIPSQIAIPVPIPLSHEFTILPITPTSTHVPEAHALPRDVNVPGGMAIRDARACRREAVDHPTCRRHT